MIIWNFFSWHLINKSPKYPRQVCRQAKRHLYIPNKAERVLHKKLKALQWWLLLILHCICPWNVLLDTILNTYYLSFLFLIIIAIQKFSSSILYTSFCEPNNLANFLNWMTVRQNSATYFIAVCKSIHYAAKSSPQNFYNNNEITKHH